MSRLMEHAHPVHEATCKGRLEDAGGYPSSPLTLNGQLVMSLSLSSCFVALNQSFSARRLQAHGLLLVLSTHRGMA